MKVKFTPINALLFTAGLAPLYAKGDLIKSPNNKLNCRKMGELSIRDIMYLKINRI